MAVSSPDNSNAFAYRIIPTRGYGRSRGAAGRAANQGQRSVLQSSGVRQNPAISVGNVSRYLPDVRNPSNFWLNALIEKQVVFNERLRMQVRTELLNATNSVNFAGPQTAITSSTFGVIFLTQVNNPRAIQFGLKVVF